MLDIANIHYIAYITPNEIWVVMMTTLSQTQVSHALIWIKILNTLANE